MKFGFGEEIELVMMNVVKFLIVFFLCFFMCECDRVIVF